MAQGTWKTLDNGPTFRCFQCDDRIDYDDEYFETETGSYCSEGCADEYESHDNGMNDIVPNREEDYVD